MVLIRGARQLLTLRGAAPRRGRQHDDIGIIHDASVLIDGEVIHSVGSTRRMENLTESRTARVLDVRGKVILPGFVDTLTRPVVPPPTAPELARRFQRWPPRNGPPASSGVPPAPPETLNSATPRALRRATLRNAQLFAMHGTTAIEARTGHGLRSAAELKALRIASALDGQPLDIATSFSVRRAPEHPIGDLETLAASVIEHLLPVIRRRRTARVCDVDCGDFDRGGLGAAVARRIFEGAASLGFFVKVVASGNVAAAAIDLALEFGAVSVDGLGAIPLEDIDRLADSRIVATLLPGAVYQTGGGGYPPARDLIDRGAAVALATGFDPAISPTFSMPAILSLACTRMRLTPAEAIAAATINGAAAIRRERCLGSLEPGKQADLVVFDVSDYREIPFSFGSNLCSLTIKKGEVIYAGPGWSGALAAFRQPVKTEPAAPNPGRLG